MAVVTKDGVEMVGRVLGIELRRVERIRFVTFSVEIGQGCVGNVLFIDFHDRDGRDVKEGNDKAMVVFTFICDKRGI